MSAPHSSAGRSCRYCGIARGVSHGSRRMVQLSYCGVSSPGESKLPSDSSTSPSRLAITRDPQLGQKCRTYPGELSQPRNSPFEVTCSAANTTKGLYVAAWDFRQVMQWHNPTRLGWAVTVNRAFPQAQPPVNTGLRFILENRDEDGYGNIWSNSTRRADPGIDLVDALPGPLQG